ncbi:MAG: hypothetical protein RQ752_03455 [Thermohalobaculum sp.]|nr:hypothetical protein [Thermohalobaculum sp.]
MRNAAMVLGIIGGTIGIVVGFFAYGFVVVDAFFSGLSEQGPINEHHDRIKLISLMAPILGIAGGAMAPGRPALATVLMAASSVGMYWGFGFTVFTMFPIAMCGSAAVLTLGAAFGRPDRATGRRAGGD